MIRDRFRGFLPVVIDVETGGFDRVRPTRSWKSRATTLRMDHDGLLGSSSEPTTTTCMPFEGANIEQSALDFTGIDPWHPFREAMCPRRRPSRQCFDAVRKEMREQACTRAVLVGHNAHFDAGFVNAAVERCDIKRNPFHPFSF